MIKLPNEQYVEWGWDKKPRTMIRKIKIGDIFCFQLNNIYYGFGQIIADNKWGHVVEIFDYIAKNTHFSFEELKNKKPILRPLLIDSYSLFDRKAGGEFRIIGYEPDYTIEDSDSIVFLMATGNIINLKGGIVGYIPDQDSNPEADKYIPYSPLKGIFIVNRLIEALIRKGINI